MKCLTTVPSGKVHEMSPGPVFGRLGASEQESPDEPIDVTNVPKEFLTAIMIPVGPWSGQLASPCPCGQPIDFEDGTTLNLIRWPSGKILLYHDGCIADLNDA